MVELYQVLWIESVVACRILLCLMAIAVPHGYCCASWLLLCLMAIAVPHLLEATLSLHNDILMWLA
jgi:hypothetical protein